MMKLQLICPVLDKIVIMKIFLSK